MAVPISLKWYAVFSFPFSSGISNAVITTESIAWLFAQITLIKLWLFHLLSLFGKNYPVAPESATVSVYMAPSSIVASAVIVVLSCLNHY